MKSITRIFGVKALSTVALLGGAILVNSAFADLVVDEVYTVPVDRTTDKLEHENGVFVVFESKPPPDKEFGIMFMQTQGNYALKPFICSDAAWLPPFQSYSCSVEREIDEIQLLESVTIGRLTGQFCKYLRVEHNGGLKKPILKNSECPAGGGNCSCYEVRHECRLDASEPYGSVECPDFATPNPGGASSKEGEKTGRTPPGRGAGSGKSN
jgi:hypothetical protein